jgi:hypothetical protein
MSRKIYAILIGSIVLAVLLVGIGVAPAVGQEGGFSLAALAEQIRDGEVDVGDEFGMALDQRFHVIHTDVIEMDCSQCHVEEAPYEIAQPSEDAPSPVDRRVCLGCHLTGPATKFYEPKE